MALPTKKGTKSRRGNRRSHIHSQPRALLTCPKCKKPVLPHRACGFCGTYRGREVIDITFSRNKEKAKQERKERAKQEQKAAEEASEKNIVT